VSEHLNVHGANKVLFEIFGGDIFLGHAGFEGLQLIDDDFILFLFGLGFADALDELLELLGEMAGCGRHD
jgi:hypothetical protein